MGFALNVKDHIFCHKFLGSRRKTLCLFSFPFHPSLHFWDTFCAFKETKGRWSDARCKPFSFLYCGGPGQRAQIWKETLFAQDVTFLRNFWWNWVIFKAEKNIPGWGVVLASTRFCHYTEGVSLAMQHKLNPSTWTQKDLLAKIRQGRQRTSFFFWQRMHHSTIRLSFLFLVTSCQATRTWVTF